MRAKPEINPDHYVSEDEAKNLRDRIGLNMGQGETVERVLYNLQSYMVDWMGYQREAVIDVLADICSFYYYGSPLPKEAAKTLGNILNDMQAEGYKAPTVDSVLRRRAEQMGCSELDGMIDSAIADQLNKTTYSKKIIPFDELPVAERLAVMERAIARGQFGGLRAKFQPG